MQDPDRPCEHENFEAEVEVNRITANNRSSQPIGYCADIRVRCDGCGERFRWVGVQAGLSPARPMCSVDEFELHAPLRPASADHDFGLGIPGYAIAVRPVDPTP